jgi:hypothetical protein
MIMYQWEDLMELRGLTVQEVVTWFVAHGVAIEDLEYDEIDESIDVGGYWSDSHPVIEFEDGIVARWFRSEDWD